MPQASERLRAQFPQGDQQALQVLEAHFHIRGNGLIVPDVHGYIPDEREGDAIDYLCDEWDYAYGEGRGDD